MNDTKTLRYAGKTFRLADPAYTGEVQHQFSRWSFTLKNETVDSLVDNLQITGTPAPIKISSMGVLAFLARLIRSPFQSDLEARKDLEIACNDINVKSAFTHTLHLLRNNYAALHALIFCLTLGVAADPATRQSLKALSEESRSQLLDSLVDQAGRYFDFTNLDGFVASIEAAPVEVLYPSVS